LTASLGKRVLARLTNCRQLLTEKNSFHTPGTETSRGKGLL